MSQHDDFVLTTPRLLLRQWQEADAAPFAALTADAEVMRHFPAVLSRKQSDELLALLQEGISKRGWGFWAVEKRNTKECIGFTGLNPAVNTPYPDAVEVGWRLSRDHWGNGYAPEAAKHSLRFAFDKLELPEVVACTTRENFASQRVMQKIGMRNCHENFKHPKVDPDSPLSEHLLYRITREEIESISP